MSHRLIMQQGEKIMSSVNDLKPVLDGLGTDMTAIAAGVSALQAKLAGISSGQLSAADQATLDSAVQEAGSLKTVADQMVASLAGASQTAASTTVAPTTAPVATTSPVGTTDPAAASTATVTPDANVSATKPTLPGPV
jgi:hypothetical protein